MALKYTKAIKNGKLKATEMQVGETVTGVLKGFKEGKDFGKGPAYNLVLEVQGREVEVYVAGNLKFIKKDVDQNKRALGAFTTITRVENIAINGYTASQFDVSQSAEQATTTTTTAASTDSIKDKLAAIRAQSGSNS